MGSRAAIVVELDDGGELVAVEDGLGALADAGGAGLSSFSTTAKEPPAVQADTTSEPNSQQRLTSGDR